MSPNKVIQRRNIERGMIWMFKLFQLNGFVFLVSIVHTYKCNDYRKTQSQYYNRDFISCMYVCLGEYDSFYLEIVMFGDDSRGLSYESFSFPFQTLNLFNTLNYTLSSSIPEYDTLHIHFTCSWHSTHYTRAHMSICMPCNAVISHLIHKPISITQTEINPEKEKHFAFTWRRLDTIITIIEWKNWMKNFYIFFWFYFV